MSCCRAFVDNVVTGLSPDQVHKVRTNPQSTAISPRAETFCESNAALVLSRAKVLGISHLSQSATDGEAYKNGAEVEVRNNYAPTPRNPKYSALY